MSVGAHDLLTMHEVVWFVLLLIIIFGIGIVMMYRLLHNCLMTKEDVRQAMEDGDMVEMQDLLFEKGVGDDVIFPPTAC